jgi:hypothetical protein
VERPFGNSTEAFAEMRAGQGGLVQGPGHRGCSARSVAAIRRHFMSKQSGTLRMQGVT